MADGEAGMTDVNAIPPFRYRVKRYEAKRYGQYFRIKVERLDRNKVLKDKDAIQATAARWFRRCFRRRGVNFLLTSPNVTEWQHGNTGEIVVWADVYAYEDFPEHDRIYIAAAAMQRPMLLYVEVFEMEPPGELTTIRL